MVPALTAPLLLLLASPSHAHCIAPGWCLLRHAVPTNVSIVALDDGGSMVTRSVRIVERGNALSRTLDVRLVANPARAGNGSAPIAGLTIFKEPYHDRNMGHAVADDAFAMFRALYAWGLHNLPRSDVRVAVPLEFKPWFDHATFGRLLAHHYAILSSHPVVFVDSDNPPTFDRLLTGWQHLSYSYAHAHFAMTAPLLAAFRQRACDALTVACPSEASLAKTCHVIIINRVNARASHTGALADAGALATAITRATGCSARVVEWETLALPDQVAAAAAATIAVGLPGAGLINAIFMPVRSALITTQRCSGDVVCQYSNEASIWFERMPHRHVFTYDLADHGHALRWRHDARLNESVLHWDADHLVAAVARARDALALAWA